MMYFEQSDAVANCVEKFYVVVLKSFSTEVLMPFCAKNFQTNSYISVQEAFRHEFSGESTSNESTIKRILDNFRENYTLEPQKRNHKKSILTQEKMSEIIVIINSQPNISARKLHLQTYTNPTSLFGMVEISEFTFLCRGNGLRVTAC